MAMPQNNEAPYVAGNGVTSPVALAQPKPPYTEEARNARIQGRVTLQCIVRKDGTVDSFKVLQGLGSGLNESVINTMATKWKFKPGTKNGIPIDVLVNIEVVFSLDGTHPILGPTDWIPPRPKASDEAILFANFESHITPSFSYGLLLPPNKQDSPSRPIIGMLIEPKISSALSVWKLPSRKMLEMPL
jgi:TonB family protein